jgi:type IV secretory pathway component VirB8
VVDAGEEEKKNNGQKAETVDVLRVRKEDRMRSFAVAFFIAALICIGILWIILVIYFLFGLL